MMKILLILSIFVFVILPDEAKKKDDYESVKIGNQVWMKKNLDVGHYRNGDPIHEVKNSYEWANLKTGAWCYYDNKPENGAIYGKLYNWYAVNDSRGLAPEGWHIPTDEEWKKLENFHGGEEIAGGKLKEASTSHWKSPNKGATNKTGFSALPGGYRNGYISLFTGIGYVGYWWSATEFDMALAWNRCLSCLHASISRHGDYNMTYGFSVRCVRD